MAFRGVTMLEVKEVLRRWLAGEFKKAISRATGVSRNIVRGLTQSAGPRSLGDEAGEGSGRGASRDDYT